MLKILKFKVFCFRFRWPSRRNVKSKVVIKKFGKTNSGIRNPGIHPSSIDLLNGSKRLTEKPIRVATFNAALFFMAPAVPKSLNSFDLDNEDCLASPNKPGLDYDLRAKSMNDRPKSILKQPQSPLHSSSMRKLRVSINLPDNEISLRRSGPLRFSEEEQNHSRILKGKAPLKSAMSMPARNMTSNVEGQSFLINRTILQVLQELNADVLALQDVKAEEEKGMKPLSDLAAALGMNYVFAESWAPEYGNAILSLYPIKTWNSQKIVDDSDVRNVLKATIDVPDVGDMNFYCTQLDHLDENWRMKQINAIMQSSNEPHILAGGLNSLEETDYSSERWTDIVKYYEEMGKPTPKVEVMKHLKSKQYTDAKDFVGQFESVVMIAKGQSVQGTCKYGTRLDYILSSQNSPYEFVPGSYSVFSSKGTSDHHIVKVDLMKVNNNDNNIANENVHSKRVLPLPRQRVVKITDSAYTKGIWKT